MDSTARKVDFVLPRPRPEYKHAERLAFVESAGSIDRLFAFELSNQMAEGDNIASVAGAKVSPTGPTLSVSDFYGSRVVVRFQGTTTADTVFRLSFTATLQSGDKIVAVGFVSVEPTNSNLIPNQFTDI